MHDTHLDTFRTPRRMLGSVTHAATSTLLLAALVSLAGCLAADSDGETTSTAVGATPAASEQAAPEPPDPERLARRQAARSVGAQAPEVQRAYYERWTASLEQSVQTQRGSLDNLRQHRAKASAANQAVIDERIAAGEQRIASLQAQLDEYQQQLASLPR